MTEKYLLGLNFQKGRSGGDIPYNNSMDSELLQARDAFPKIASVSLISNERLSASDSFVDELAWKTPSYLQPIWERLFSVSHEEQRHPLDLEIRRKRTEWLNNSR